MFSLVAAMLQAKAPLHTHIKKYKINVLKELVFRNAYASSLLVLFICIKAKSMAEGDKYARFYY